jgi:hypothetical protein
MRFRGAIAKCTSGPYKPLFLSFAAIDDKMREIVLKTVTFPLYSERFEYKVLSHSLT